MSTTSSTSSKPSPAEWSKIVELSKATQLSLRAFSAEVGVPLQQLYNWRSKLKASVPRRRHGFKQIKPKMDAVPNPVQEHGAIELHLRNGRMLRVTGGHVDAQLLQTMVQVAQAGDAC